MTKYIDIHSHVHGKEYDSDRGDVLTRMNEYGVGSITVGTHLETSRWAVELAEKHDILWATIGLHPTDTRGFFKASDYEEISKSPKVVAIGECGLDYFRLAGNDIAEKDRQKENFLAQLDFAVSIDKPLMIHCRPSGLPAQAGKTADAHEDMLTILSEKKSVYKEKLRGNIHFFTGTIDIAKRYFGLGFTVSFPGIITFASEYESLVRECPMDMILSETDSPYASPLPYRGKRNEPVYVIETIKKIASIRGESEDFMARALLLNAKRTFGLVF